MKKILFLLLFIIVRWSATAQINASDSVIFDLSRATCTANFFVVPVSVKSNDVIYAIDFSMKYNQSKITYNSIINYYPGSVVPSANYNTIDSTLRFTSFCMSSMAHADTAIVSVRFNLLLNPIMVSDFNTIHTYLNGDACSYKIIPPLPATIASTGPTVINSGDTLTLIGTQGNGLTYLWSTNATSPAITVTLPGTYTVTVTTSGGCSSSTSLNIIPGSPLPVELVNFTAAENNGAVIIEWTTASEINNNYFTVEKTDGGSVWEELEKIPGAGNSSTIRNYLITDSQPFAGINYYRLKQTDFDGTFEYSEIVSVYFTKHEDSFSVYVFPNPVQETLNIMATKTATHQLFDSKGQLVMLLSNIPADSKQQINTRELTDGIYTLRIFNENSSVVKKIVIANK